MTTENSFYKNLKPFTDSIELTDLKHFVPAPPSWFLVITDIEGSTKAIDEGRYKDVNVVGAATIVATHNACPGIEFPYVFGGDGATLLIPPEIVPAVKRALSHTRAVAKAQFDLTLRIATIPIEKIYAEKKEILIAKLELSPKNAIAMIQGGGVTLGEKWLKDKPDYNLPESQTADGELTGLECRWNPVKASKDKILSLIIQTQKESPELAVVYKEILTKIIEIVPSLRPVTAEKMSLTWPPKHLIQELKMRNLKGLQRRIKYLSILALTWIFAKIIPKQIEKKDSKVSIYLHQLAKNTDYLKFDDTLRMTIDVSLDEEIQIRQLLEDRLRKGQIFYGLHTDDEALMTCFIQTSDQHIHFVDCGGGGYAMAAKEFKQQKRTGSS